MTIDEAIKHCLEVAEEQEKDAEYHREWHENYYEKDCRECATEHRQLAEWLTDYKELKNSIGAAKFSNMKEALELIREYKAENIAQKKLIAEYKRLLKAAVEDINYYVDCYEAHCDECCCNQNNHCHWKHEAEALALIGEDTNVPASADDTNVGGKKDGEQNV